MSGITALAALLLGGTASAQTFTPPPVVTFSGSADASLEAAIASQLKGQIKDGRLEVQATAQPGQGVLTTSHMAGSGPRGAFVDVTASFPPGATDAAAGPGLLIKHAKGATGRSFFALVLTPSGYRVGTWTDGANGSSITGSLPSSVRPGEPVRLAARETGAGAEFFINGQRVGSLSVGAVSGSDVGLVAFGSGTYTFDNYGLNRTADIGSANAEAAGNGPAPQPSPTPTPTSPSAPPSPPPAAAQLAVWVAENGKPVGPLTEPALRQRITAGTLTRSTLSWMDGMPQWRPASEIPALAALLPPG